jgi:hypothetical protein
MTTTDNANCEMCNKWYLVEDMCLGLNDICYGTEKNINKFEKKHSVDIGNYFCSDCASKSLKEIENDNR